MREPGQPSDGPKPVYDKLRRRWFDYEPARSAAVHDRIVLSSEEAQAFDTIETENWDDLFRRESRVVRQRRFFDASVRIWLARQKVLDIPRESRELVRRHPNAPVAAAITVALGAAAFTAGMLRQEQVQYAASATERWIEHSVDDPSLPPHRFASVDRGIFGLGIMTGGATITFVGCNRSITTALRDRESTIVYGSGEDAISVPVRQHNAPDINPAYFENDREYWFVEDLGKDCPPQPSSVQPSTATGTRDASGG